MKSVTKICMMLLVLVFTTAAVFAQNNAKVEGLSKIELSMMNKVNQGSVHPNYQSPDNIMAVPVSVFPYSQNFEAGWPAEFEDVSGTYADAYVASTYAYSGESYFSTAISLTGWGSTPYTYAAAFDPALKWQHFGTSEIDVIPSGSSGVLTMEYMFAQGFSFNGNYSWFRVLVDGSVIFDDQGAYYWQPTTHYTSTAQYTQKVFDMSSFVGAPFTISLQSSCKYQVAYYNEGDWAAIDDFMIYYMLDPGDLEGYVFNGAGLTIAGATVGVEGQGITTTNPAGYYYLAGIMGGSQVAYAWKQGYNYSFENVTIPPAGIGYQDFYLMAPTMFITPTAHDRTMHPNEYTTTPPTGILNTGDGTLAWEAIIEYPVTDVIAEYPRTSMPNPNVEYSPMQRDIEIHNSSRATWDLQFNFPTNVHPPANTGAESDGVFIYTTDWQGGNFMKYAVDGTLLETFTCGAASAIRDIAYCPSTGYFYGAAASTTLYIMDFATQTVVGTVTAPTACRAIAYNDDNDSFYANDWSTAITEFDRETGTNLGSFSCGPVGASYYGFAYDNWTDGGPYLWGFAQIGNLGTLVQIHLPDGVETGFVYDIMPIIGAPAGSMAGGLYTTAGLVPGTVTIGGCVQNELLFGFELAQGGPPPPTPVVPDNLLGYNVYRDLGVIAYVPYNDEDTSHYYDTDLEPLTYQYDVSALYDLAPYGFPGDTGESALEGPYIVQVTYGHPLPFNEEWVSGAFDLNQWSHEGNWRVNGQIGDPEPSAEFTWDPVISDYRSAMTSYPIDGINVGDPFIDGNIWFDYTVRLDDRNTTGDEFLKIDVGTAGNWQTIATYDNANGSFDWKNFHHNISGIAFGEIFRIRFVAEGVNSSDILSWFVDNIHVYRTCAGVRNLTAIPGTGSVPSDLCGEVYLNWNSPATGGGGGGGFGEWIHWDDGINIDGIGLTGGGVFSVASHWDPDMLVAYQGANITKIRFYVYDNVIASAYTVMVWEGAMGGTLLYEQDVTGTTAAAWFEHTLTSAVAIDVTQELWFGYTVNQPDLENPAGFDAGPGVTGYGDMINLGGWEPIMNYGFDLNWNLQAYVTDETGDVVAMEPKLDNIVRTQGDLNADNNKEVPGIAPNYNTGNRELQGYNIYVNGAFLDFTADTTYLHTVTVNDLYTYEVTALYEDCESDTAAGPVSVDVFCVGINDLLDDEGFAVYPNPAKEVLNIMSSQDIQIVTILNNVGQVVYNHKVVNDNLLTINTSSYEAGVYMVKIETEDNIIVRKIIIAQ